MLFTRLAVACLVAGSLASAAGPSSAAESTGPNLVNNPSLEAGATFPDCFQASGWGTAGTWSFSPGRTGGRALSLTVSGYTSGDRKLLQAETAACAPKVTAGQVYNLGVWYQSTVPVSITTFRHTASGWTYWGDLGRVAASAGWTEAKVATPAVPAGTDQIAFGLSIAANGKLTTDDYSLFATSTGTTTPTPAPAGGELVVNGTLATGSPVPTCFTTTGWGNRTVSQALSTDIPATAPAGSRSWSITVSNYVSGDAKLLPSETAACAPAVKAGSKYNLSIDYKSTSPRNSITVFTHTAAGWGYWTDLAQPAASSTWAQSAVTTPAIPAGVDAISFGMSVSANGTLKTTNYSLKEVASPPPPSGTPAQLGSWEVFNAPMPLRSIHSTLLSDGRLLLIAGSGNDGAAFNAGTFKASVWNPATNTFTSIPVPYDMFCAGHVTLPDGKVLLGGGTLAFPAEGAGPTTFKGSKKSYYFDPKDNTFHPVNDMAGGHWYPTLTKLGNGDIWAAGGLDEKAEGTVLTEMFQTSTMKWLPSGNVPQTWSFWGTYPHMYLLNDGRMFYSGGHTFGNGLPGTGASLYNWQTAQIWDVPGLRQKDMRDQAGSVLLGPAQDQKVMIVGGGNTETNLPAINLVDIIDLKQPNPAYVPGPDLPGPGKAYVNVLNLPDRTVLAANGAQHNRAGDVLTAAVYQPATNSWLSIGADPVGRNYHSSSILLPDGRVAVLGSNPLDNSFELRISVYSPKYMFNGTRPTITAAPATATRGQQISLKTTGTIKAAQLMSPMSATHQTDTNARLVDLPMTTSGGNVNATIPSNPNLLPPGPYMLTVLDTDNRPSIAKWVWIS
ncbi:galactose oxidase early set domain-containing protein [Pseudarthrobacter phenanthrenivorans]|uniref:galactose oxidase early set domain-containing protein n=1 Tax=Pseudarthrobacter phenanthrenivorans TaxID=361575 RepID=UPI0020B817CD|nr:galactose oxidase early set domain-containing protein [Pseudarthrobacter phenanthrenivorans]